MRKLNALPVHSVLGSHTLRCLRGIALQPQNEQNTVVPFRGMAPQPPILWNDAICRVAKRQILPLELGGPKDQTYNAWRGDKFLSTAAAKVIHYSGRRHTKGTATKLTDTALSNSFMAKHKDVLLPEISNMLGHLSEHGISTILEAAVAEIYEANERAVHDLARWLLEKAETMPDPNAKGQLLHHGGSVYVKANREGSAHSPVYTAVAELHGMLAEGQGCTKKKAEQLASERVLAQCSM